MAGRLPDIRLVLQVAPLSALAMLITFAATTQLPLHTAILIGVITSLVLYCVKASRSAQLVALQQTDDGNWRIIPVPDRCPSNDVTVLHYAGVGLFAEVARIDEEWPKTEGSTNAVVVLSLRMLPDVPSSVAIKALRRWAGDTAGARRQVDRRGVTPAAEKILERGGLTTCSGADGIVPATDRVFGALDDRRRAGPGMDSGPQLADFLAAVIRINQHRASAAAWTATMTAACRAARALPTECCRWPGRRCASGACSVFRYGSICDFGSPPCWSIHAFAAWQACEYSSSVDSASAPMAVVTPPGDTSMAPGAGVCVSELVGVVDGRLRRRGPAVAPRRTARDDDRCRRGCDAKGVDAHVVNLCNTAAVMDQTG